MLQALVERFEKVLCADLAFNHGGPGNLPEEREAELAARTLAFPDAQSVEDLTALLTSAGER